LQIGSYVPGKDAARITSPVLFCICNRDSVAPAAKALEYARQAPRGEIKAYDVGHFNIYVDEDFERVIADQIDFLQRNVPAAA